MKLIAFCEAAADFRMLSGLVDRALRDHVEVHGPTWIFDQLDTAELVRTWHPDASGAAYFDVHRLNAHTDELRKRGVLVRQVRGHFDGRPGGAGGAMARKAFLLVEALNKHMRDDEIDAVVLLWDIDQQPERSDAVRVARDSARQWASFSISCGFPDPEREAWVLAGFVPSEPDEQERLDEVHRELTFSPVQDAHRLRDKKDGATRNIKRVLKVLIGDDTAREERCWLEPPLSVLRERGRNTGLAEFLRELQGMLTTVLGTGVLPSR